MKFGPLFVPSARLNCLGKSEFNYHMDNPSDIPYYQKVLTQMKLCDQPCIKLRSLDLTFVAPQFLKKRSLGHVNLIDKFKYYGKIHINSDILNFRMSPHLISDIITNTFIHELVHVFDDNIDSGNVGYNSPSEILTRRITNTIGRSENRKTTVDILGY